MGRKYFGTDGIRGKVGDAPITPEFMLRLGWAAGCVMAERANDSANKLIVIGKDTRISGYMFESALQAGLINGGVDVALLGPMPTPAIAYLTHTFHAQAGIVISASHNPFFDNGIKFFSGEGKKLPDDVEAAIEAQLDQPIHTAERLGKARRIEDAGGRYVEFCKGSLPWGFTLRGLKIVLDCANGATYHVAPDVFRELGASVECIGVEPDGLNINKECGSTSPARLQAKVLETGADIGIAFDGDGDRVLFVDDKGKVVDGDELIYVIAAYRQQFKDGCNGVVGTVMTNFGCELALKELKIPFIRAKVGDRHVLEAMQSNEWFLGGESSGHIICSDVTTTGDGIMSALQVLLALQSTQQSLHDAKQGMRKLPQSMINVRIAQRIDIDSNTAIQQAVTETESQLNGRGRVLLRPSGTEPVIRVMVEGDEPTLVQSLAKELAETVERAIS